MVIPHTIAITTRNKTKNSSAGAKWCHGMQNNKVHLQKAVHPWKQNDKNIDNKHYDWDVSHLVFDFVWLLVFSSFYSVLCTQFHCFFNGKNNYFLKCFDWLKKWVLSPLECPELESKGKILVPATVEQMSQKLKL